MQKFSILFVAAFVTTLVMGMEEGGRYNGNTVTICGRLGAKNEWMVLMSQDEVGYMSKKIEEDCRMLFYEDCRGNLQATNRCKFEYKGPCRDWLDVNRMVGVFALVALSNHGENCVVEHLKGLNTETCLRHAEVINYLDFMAYAGKPEGGVPLFRGKSRVLSMVVAELASRLDCDHKYLTHNALPDVAQLIVVHEIGKRMLIERCMNFLGISKRDFQYSINEYERAKADAVLTILTSGKGLTPSDVILLTHLINNSGGQLPRRIQKVLENTEKNNSFLHLSRIDRILRYIESVSTVMIQKVLGSTDKNNLMLQLSKINTILNYIIVGCAVKLIVVDGVKLGWHILISKGIL